MGYQMIEKYRTALQDKETIYNKSQYHIGKNIEIYTTDQVDMRRLIKLHDQHPDECRILSDDHYGMSFSIPANWLKIRAPRVLSAEQKKEISERLSAHRAKK